MSENREIALKFVDSIDNVLSGDLITDDFGWWTSYHHGVMNAAEMRAMIADARTDHEIGGLTMEVIGMVVGEDRVAVEVQGRCPLPDGRNYDNNYCFILDIRDGRISRVHEYTDTKLAADMFAIKDIAARTQNSAEKAA